MKMVLIGGAAAIVILVLVFSRSPESPYPVRSGRTSPGAVASGTTTSLPSASAGVSTSPPAPDPREVKAVTREMVGKILEALLSKGKQKDIKACFDAIRRYGPAAVEPLMEILAGSDAVDFKMAALQALGGLRRMARETPLHVKEGRSPEEIAKLLDVPVETIRRQIESPGWKAENTEAMIEASCLVARQSPTAEFRTNALSTLSNLSSEPSSAGDRLMEFARDTGADAAFRIEALNWAAESLRPEQAGALSAMSTDLSQDLTIRLKAGLGFLKAAKGAGSPGDVDALRQSTVATAHSMAVTPGSGTSAQRAMAVELYGKSEGALAHPTLVKILDQETDDAVRCSAMGTLFETKGAEAARESIQKISEEKENSGAKRAAMQILKVMPKK